MSYTKKELSIVKSGMSFGVLVNWQGYWNDTKAQRQQVRNERAKTATRKKMCQNFTGIKNAGALHALAFHPPSGPISAVVRSQIEIYNHLNKMRLKYGYEGSYMTEAEICALRFEYEIYSSPMGFLVSTRKNGVTSTEVVKIDKPEPLSFTEFCKKKIKDL